MKVTRAAQKLVKPLEDAGAKPTSVKAPEAQAVEAARSFKGLAFTPKNEAPHAAADLYGTHASKERTAQPKGYPQRAAVPEANAAWDVPLGGYAPAAYTALAVIANDVTKKPNGWADPESTTLAAALHPLTRGAGPVKLAVSAQLNDSETGEPMKVPLNPNGRTGIEGRGLLGRWGANFAADAMLTRVNGQGELELFVIRRGDTGEWALPGGMAEPGEEAAQTAARELEEEAGVRLDLGNARVVYSGHVDDPRNTDNAWMETTVEHKHLPAAVAATMHFKAGDDATDSKWLTVTKDNIASLYASHGAFVKDALKGWSEPGLEMQIAAALG